MRRDSVKTIALQAAPKTDSLGESAVECCQERLPLGIVRDRDGEGAEPLQIDDLLLDRGEVFGGERLDSRRGLFPFFGRFVERFVILIQFIFERLLRLVLGDLRLQSHDERGRARPRWQMWTRPSSFRSTSVIRDR